ncbi:ferric reductase like transmembrane component, partial [Fusarium heterosporum]
MQQYYPAATVIYAVCLGSLVILVITRSLLRVLLELCFPQVAFIWKARQDHTATQQIKSWISEHIIYKTVFGGSGSHSRSVYILSSSYLAGNLSCILIGASDLATITVRSGHVALINCSLLFIGPSLNFTSDLLDFPLHVQKKVHATVGYIVGIVTAIHTFTALSSTRSFPASSTGNLCAIL